MTGEPTVVARGTVDATVPASGAALGGPTRPLARGRRGELAPGSHLNRGRYVVRRVLGRGGFGITYECDDTSLARRVAVKELAPSYELDGFEAARERFLREATVLARFNHEGIVRVFEVFEEHGTAYLVMELLEGRSLAERLAAGEGPWPEAEVLGLAERIGEALTTLHAAGILHRDLNPANVIVTGSGRAVLVDFGLAREFAPDQTGSMTRVVTPGYAPPEQYTGTSRFGPPTDVYGLAATLYALLCGRAPVPAVDRQSGAPLPSPHVVRTTVSRRVGAAVMDGLELQPAHRPQTVVAFLARLGVGAPPAAAPSPAVPASPWPVAGGEPVATPAPRRAAVHRAPGLASPRAAGEGWLRRLGALVPWRNGAAEAERLRRANSWKVAAPLLAAAAALGSCAPVAVPALLAVVVVPAVATAGDAVAFVRLRRTGDRLRWLHRVALPGYLAGRFVTNLAGVLRRAVPALLVASAAVATALLLPASDAYLLRPAGAAEALLVVVPVFRDRAGFRAAAIADEVRDHLLDERGRLTPPGIVVAAVGVALAIAGLAFHPELWPVRS